MSILIKGANLTPVQQREVLATFTMRLTTENGYPQRNPCGATVEAITDQQWLEAHAFHYVNDGSRLSATHQHCVPEYMAYYKVDIL